MVTDICFISKKKRKQRGNCQLILRLYMSLIMSLYRDVSHLRQECHNSKFGIFELLVEKETFEDAILTGVVS